MKTYSQYEDDLFVLSYFNGGGEYYGIEVGAADGIFLSTTKLLEENGWNILCIEPNPLSFKKCQENRKVVLPYAVGNENKNNVNFTIFNLDRDHNNQDAISSLKPDLGLIREHEEFGVLLNSYVEYVNVRTLDFCIFQWLQMMKIYNTNFELDFVSIDTEGTEMDVIDGFDLKKWNPKLIEIENNWQDPLYRIKMEERGYKLINVLGINDFYAKS